MVDFQSLEARATAAAAGVVLHLFTFRRGEWDLEFPRLFGSFLTVQAVGTAALLFTAQNDAYTLGTAFSTVAKLVFSVLGGIAGSMVLYRAFFHRLRKFPGPFMARISNVYPTLLAAKKLHLYEEVQQLHETYGDFLRLGPTELSITHPKSVTAIYSAQSPCRKGPWYNVLYPMVSLQMIRDKQEHSRRRKVWDRGFNAKSLREYEPRVVKYTDQLLKAIADSNGKPINATAWFNYYSFDVMGDLAFGKSFGMLERGTTHYFMSSLHTSMEGVGYFGHMQWLYPIFKETPILNAEYKKFQAYLKGEVDSRISAKPDRPDVFSWILDDFESNPNPTKQQITDLIGDAYLIVVAGSDTTAATLGCLFYELSKSPAKYDALQKEVDQFYEENEVVDATSLGKFKYLDAAIHEALRLHPPVPSGLQRVTPSEGLRIGDTFIPGDTIVQVPLHTVFRDPRNFGRPDEFIPERWTTQPELTKNASVFIPFSIGPYSCVGKQLGLMEVRCVAANIIRKYNVGFAPGEIPQSFVEGKKDTFTLALPSLQLVFAPRK